MIDNDLEFCVTGVEHSLQRFLELARQTEAHFLSERLTVSTQKPDQVLKEVQRHLASSNLTLNHPRYQ